MIQTDEIGQDQLDQLNSLDYDEFTEWESVFLTFILDRLYGQLTGKQKTTVSNLWEKYFK